MASRSSFSEEQNKESGNSSQAEASLGAIFQTAYTSATQGSRPSTELYEAADYFEDAQLFAADSDHEEDRGECQKVEKKSWKCCVFPVFSCDFLISKNS